MNTKFNIYLIISTLLFSGLFLTSCVEDELESDAGKVIPVVKNLNGATVGYEAQTSLYTVTPTRGGSEYIWTITGAEAQPITGESDKMNVYFNQITDPVSVSVVEKAANGLVSEPKTINLTAVLGIPCDWTLEMQDEYGDGWNGASLTFTFEGIELGQFTIADGSTGTEIVPVPNGGDVTVSFTSGDWDSEVTYQIYDANGDLVFADGPTPAIGDVFTATNTCP